jgi:hypothetical protein
MDVKGFWPILGVGVLGGLVPQVIAWSAVFQNSQTPTRGQLVAGLLVAALGGLVVLFGVDEPRNAFEVATQGAAFPGLFTAGAKAATAGKRTQQVIAPGQRLPDRSPTDEYSRPESPSGLPADPEGRRRWEEERQQADQRSTQAGERIEQRRRPADGSVADFLAWRF